MSENVRVYVNAVGIDVPAGATALGNPARIRG